MAIHQPIFVHREEAPQYGLYNSDTYLTLWIPALHEMLDIQAFLRTELNLAMAMGAKKN